MPPKRPLDPAASPASTPPPSAKQRKKLKQQIAVQATASHPAAPSDAAPLPRALAVVDAINARSFEIASLESAIRNASEFTGNQRVFQSVPRHMRRRAASHNVKRLPVRVRRRALDQMAKDTGNPQTAAKKRYKRRKPESRRAEFMARPAHNRWLETHVWHAKRMRMAPLWNHILAVSTNARSTRASFRAGAHTGATIHDASYSHAIQISAISDSTTTDSPCDRIASLLRLFLDPNLPDPALPDFVRGDRHLVSFFHRKASFPAGTIAPVEIMWKPTPSTAAQTEACVWIWTHSATHSTILESLQLAVAEMNQGALSVRSLKGEFTRFELCGPRAHPILSECLRLCFQTECSTINAHAHDVWNQLASLHSPACLPPGVVLGLTIHDPRLSFPIKMPSRSRTSQTDPQSDDKLIQLISAWPQHTAATSSITTSPNQSDIHPTNDIWDAGARDTLFTSRADTKAIQKRRSENLVPGMPIPPTATDSTIPILLVHRANHYSMHFNRNEFVGGWDIIIPRGWSMDFWLTFIFAGARAIGINDRRTLHFESHMPSFPHDYPESPVYMQDADHMRVELEAKYKRTPKGKKPNFDKLQAVSAFEPPFHALMGSGEETQTAIDAATRAIEHAPSATDPADGDAMEVDTAVVAQPTPPLTRNPIVVLHSPSLVHLIASLFSAATTTKSSQTPSFDQICDTLIAHVFTSIKKRCNEMSAAPHLTRDVFANAFIRVLVTPHGKGVLADRAILYSPESDDDAKQWKSTSPISDSNHPHDMFSTDNSATMLDKIPSPYRIIGFVTTGQFSFDQGQCQAIACCNLRRLFDGIRRAPRATSSLNRNGSLSIFALVRGITGRVCRPVSLKLIP